MSSAVESMVQCRPLQQFEVSHDSVSVGEHVQLHHHGHHFHVTVVHVHNHDDGHDHILAEVHAHPDEVIEPDDAPHGS